MGNKKTLGFFIVLIFANSTGLVSNGKAQENYLGINDDDVFIWGIDEINSTSFENVFGYDPNYARGELFKLRVRNIIEDITSWFVQVEFWDYGSNWEEYGIFSSIRIYKDPISYEGELFVPLPVNTYLQEVVDVSSEDYYLIGLSLYKDEGNYLSQKEYNSNGVMITETYFDQYNNTIVKLKLLGIKVKSPRSSDRVISNSDFIIKWDSTGPIDTIIINLYNLQSGFLESITKNSTENDGEFTWNTGSLQGSYYFLRIINYDIPQIFDTSEYFFIVEENVQTIPSYTLIFLIGMVGIISILIIKNGSVQQKKIRKNF